MFSKIRFGFGLPLGLNQERTTSPAVRDGGSQTYFLSSNFEAMYIVKFIHTNSS